MTGMNGCPLKLKNEQAGFHFSKMKTGFHQQQEETRPTVSPYSSAMGDPFVVGWLAELGIDSSTSSGLDVIRKFQEEGIDSHALASLDDAQLKELGVKRMGDRAKLQDKATAKVLAQPAAEAGAPRARTAARARAKSPGPARFTRNDQPSGSENGSDFLLVIGFYSFVVRLLLFGLWVLLVPLIGFLLVLLPILCSIGFFYVVSCHSPSPSPGLQQRPIFMKGQPMYPRLDLPACRPLVEFIKRKGVECGCVDTLGSSKVSPGQAPTVQEAFWGISNTAKNCGTRFQALICTLASEMYGMDELAKIYSKCFSLESVSLAGVTLWRPAWF